MPHSLIAQLAQIVGRRHVLTSERLTQRYRQGYRFGGGPVFAVVRPGTLVEQWRVLIACVGADVVVIAQAANTGLTGGSTPDGSDYDRPVVIINTLRIGAIHLLREGRQVLCLSGATLDRLGNLLRPLGRQPHSLIGSSCIGASVIGGVSNNSGGSLVRRGPAYTQLALFARRESNGRLVLVNHLGIELGDAPEDILAKLDAGDLGVDVLAANPLAASDSDYCRHVRDVAADTPARFNADPRTLYEAAGCAGKLMIFAVRLDTFESESADQVFYIGSNDPDELGALRHHILTQFNHLPVAAEYIHRDAFDMAERYGKDTFLAVRGLGAERLPRLFAAKAWIDGFAPRGLSDGLLQAVARLFPSHIPERMREWRRRFEHHLLLRVTGAGIAEADAELCRMFPSRDGDMFRCTREEGEKAFVHRFAVAGAAVRYRAVHGDTVEDIVALDIALPRNASCWFEQLPDTLAGQLVSRLYYGHFLCHVFHQDYLVAKGGDAEEIEREMLRGLDARGAIYPAEHNFGHKYAATDVVASHYRALDPTNTFNPGIGCLTRMRDWRDKSPAHSSQQVPYSPEPARDRNFHSHFEA